MKIEEAIKQKSFESPLQKALINLHYTSNYMAAEAKQMFAGFDLTGQQFNVLRILRGSHPRKISPGDIKAVMIDKTPDLTRLIDRMLTKGLVTRAVSESNRRKVDIGITNKGLDLLAEIDPRIRKDMQEFDRITSEEAEELSRILDKLRG